MENSVVPTASGKDIPRLLVASLTVAVPHYCFIMWIRF